jgi:hypothetical protein
MSNQFLNFSKNELYILGLCLSAIGSFVFLLLLCALYRSRSRDHMLHLTEPEDLPTEEYDPDYSEDLGDDC